MLRVSEYSYIIFLYGEKWSKHHCLDFYCRKSHKNIPKNKNEFEMRKIHNDFMSQKYDEFQLFLSGDVKIPHLEKKLGQYGIS